MARATDAVQAAEDYRVSFDADSYAATFRTPEGVLAGRVVWDPGANQWLVDFTLLWDGMA
jgi:hypothetical protein